MGQFEIISVILPNSHFDNLTLSDLLVRNRLNWVNFRLKNSNFDQFCPTIFTELFRDANVLDCCWWVEKLEILKSVWKMQNKLSRTAQCRITRLDKYEMLETVGEGAYGIVWKARNRGKVLSIQNFLLSAKFI